MTSQEFKVEEGIIRAVGLDPKPVAYRVQNSGGVWLYFDVDRKSVAERQSRNYNPPHEIQPLYTK